MFALADCNNFFVSCERVFRPELNGKPVVVLSSNDGCAIARSNEAKRLGIKMGTPLFQLRDIIKQHDVTVFSSNMPLYADFSRRVRMVLREYAPHIEVYSIDEAFLDLRGIDNQDFDKKEQLEKEGIPRTFSNKSGGNLAGVESNIDYLASLGYKIQPANPIAGGDNKSSHHYWNKNNFQISDDIGNM